MRSRSHGLLRRSATAFVLVVASGLTGCMVGPNYRRPAVSIPDSYRGAISPPESESLADLEWWKVFTDPRLQELIRKALAQNYDLREAVARVDAARSNLGIVRADQYPNLAAGANIQANRASRNGAIPLSPVIMPNQNRVFGGATLAMLSFEADIWGRLRRATEAARANLLAAEENRKAVVTTLVSDVATAYFTLCELDSELDISRRTLASRKESLDLIQTRQRGGLSTLLDIRQAEELVYSAEDAIPAVEQRIAQTENRINLLLGMNPDSVIRGRGLAEQQPPPAVPAGLPSALLARRPDIRAAEQDLIAANARIGVARAAYFPRISLTGFLGGQSTQLSDLFGPPNSVWNFAPQLTAPIFMAGRLGANVELAKAERAGALAVYEKAIRTAFAEVSDALIAHQKLRERRTRQEMLVKALQDRTRLAYVRYHGGVDSLLNALDADRSLFQAQLALRQVILNELLSVVQLYKALGGGWT
ncbi:MAG: Outer membrane protein OprM [Bryobacteraceae bacterium]|nr:Outer membrane protein OprM [Bryobacteraceae bacterium]